MINQELKLQILGGRRTTVDGKTYAKLFVGQPEDKSDERGVQVMTMPCDPDIIDKLEAKSLPAELDVKVRMKVAGGGKAGMQIVDIGKPTGKAHAPR